MGKKATVRWDLYFIFYIHMFYQKNIIPMLKISCAFMRSVRTKAQLLLFINKLYIKHLLHKEFQFNNIYMYIVNPTNSK